MDQVSRRHPFYVCNRCGQRFQALIEGMVELEDEYGVYEEEGFLFDPENSYELMNAHDSKACKKKEWSWEDESYYYD